MKYTYLFLCILSGHLLLAQSDNLIFVNGLDVNDERYPDVKESPYLFGDDWHPADLLTKDMKRVANVPTRYNLYTGEFEVRQDDKFIRLANERFMRVEFEVNEAGEAITDPGEKFIFQASPHPRFRDRFINMIYANKEMVVFRDYRSIIEEKTIQDVGKTVKFKRFDTKVDYYVIQQGDIKNVRLTKKNLSKLLGHKKELEAFIKKNKLDLRSAVDLNKVFTFAETLG